MIKAYVLWIALCIIVIGGCGVSEDEMQELEKIEEVSK